MTPLTNPVRAWSRASNHVVSSMLEANRATLAAMGMTNGTDTAAAPGVDSVEYESPQWSFDRTADAPGALAVGDTVTFTKTLSESDIQAFAHASGDTNSLHLDDEFAADSRFGERIAHGTLVSGLISAALARLPGVTVYLSQDMEFLAPVSIGDRVTATVEVAEDLGDDRYRLTTTVDNEETEFLVGEAVVLVDSLPDGDGE